MPTIPYSFRNLAEMADFMDARADEITAQANAMIKANVGKRGGGKISSHRLSGAAAEARMLADLLRHAEIEGGSA